MSQTLSPQSLFQHPAADDFGSSARDPFAEQRSRRVLFENDALGALEAAEGAGELRWGAVGGRWWSGASKLDGAPWLTG
eukprot:Skav200746  [mRNA]  locus=scaffold1117:35920:36156:- [translate_table: standard]